MSGAYPLMSMKSKGSEPQRVSTHSLESPLIVSEPVEDK
jgi:hypothetical protein